MTKEQVSIWLCNVRLFVCLADIEIRTTLHHVFVVVTGIDVEEWLKGPDIQRPKEFKCWASGGNGSVLFLTTDVA